MLQVCSFTYYRVDLLTNRQTFIGIRKHFRDRSRGFAKIRNMFLKFVKLLLHLGEYPNAALIPGRIS